ncbi:hypothetical protein DZF91_36580 [Actinomadura logoneensis]|uniref:Uncharacterized protein n=1 Tax=Actinomadura logoneensis TaxID=2293572 RepID=A0A372JAA2_9ACTN|nr:hypothetical protein [Actinomadura logoneensis]RFU36746.1 hypothetical protein DZF91_36580 [Actinomadura logoneensis]
MPDLEKVAALHPVEREPSPATRAAARTRLMDAIASENTTRENVAREDVKREDVKREDVKREDVTREDVMREVAVRGKVAVRGRDGRRRGRRGRTAVPGRPAKAGFLLLAGALAAALVTLFSLVTGNMRDPLPYYAIEPLHYQEGDAARLLLTAADGAAKSSRTGGLWYRKSSIGMTVVVRSPIRPGVTYAVQVERDDHLLASTGEPHPAREAPGRPSGAGTKAASWEWPGDRLTVRPVSAVDAARWEADGRPGAEELGAGRPERSLGPEMGADGPVLDFGVAEARRLPADPARLRAALLNYAVRVGGRRVPDPDAYLYRGASFLLVDAPVDDAVRIAVYRLLAGLRGVRTVTAADATGRRRQGVALRTTSPEYGTIDSELLIDPGTGRLVASQEVVVTPGARDADLRPGDRWRYEVVRQAGWTDRPAESLLPR